MFKKLEAAQFGSGVKLKDNVGTVMVKIVLLDPEKRGSNFPVSGNIKKEIFLGDTTVGEVVEVIESALFDAEDK